MVGWEHCRNEYELTNQEIAAVYAFENERAAFAMDLNSYAAYAGQTIQGGVGLMLPDPVTMAIALDNSVCSKRSWHYVDVACDEELTRGMTVVDELHVTKKAANLEVCWKVDVAKWKETLYKTLR